MPGTSELNSFPLTVTKLGFPKSPTATQLALSTVPIREQHSGGGCTFKVLLSWEEKERKPQFTVKIMLEDCC